MMQQRRDRLNALIWRCRARVQRSPYAAIVVLIAATMMICLPVMFAPLAAMSRQVGVKAENKNANAGKATKPPVRTPPAPKVTKPPVRTPPAAKTQESRVDALAQLRKSFVQIPAGEFMRGSENGDADEKPAHRVRISRGFEMGKYQVTQAQWQAVMGSNPSNFKGANLPVENVSWDDAQQFIQKLNGRSDGYVYRLPTEAEWEYACRAGSTKDYVGNLAAMAWYSNNSGDKAHPVGMKQPNAWGLYDMHGNVWEWCQDWYDKNYYAQSPNLDPTGSSTGSDRVCRGGSWSDTARDCRSANRGRYAPVNRDNNLGLRLVRTYH